VEPALEPMPDVPGEEAAEILDQAEDIINTVGPSVLADVREEDAGRSGKRAAGGDGVAERGRRLLTRSSAGCPGGYRPVNTAGRFSMKAVIASARSSEVSAPAFQVAT